MVAAARRNRAVRQAPRGTSPHQRNRDRQDDASAARLQPRQEAGGQVLARAQERLTSAQAKTWATFIERTQRLLDLADLSAAA